jgi:hypothetical protein
VRWTKKRSDILKLMNCRVRGNADFHPAQTYKLAPWPI